MITREEFEAPRTAADILAWVDAAGERLSATKELKAAARLGRNGAKELWGEARPIALFAHRYFDASRQVTIRHVIGNQNYDATVDDRREHPGPVRFIEVTLSDQTRDDSIRMELLNRDGHAPGTGPVRAEGPRDNRRILEGRSEAVDHVDLREQALGAVRDAIARKLGVQYPAGTALIVRIDDHLPFRNDEDVDELNAVAAEHFVPLVRGREFCLLALVGSRATNLVYAL
jgi:hypothetical protein